MTAWWYPYPFLDPHGDGGWGSALMYIAAIFVAFVGIGAGIIAIGRHRERRAARRVGAGGPGPAVRACSVRHPAAARSPLARAGRR